MEDKDKDEELIEKFIERRKQENDAFLKLLQAIENKGSPAESKPKAEPRPKTASKSLRKNKQE